MTYEETLSYLYQQLPMYSRIGAAAYKEDLDNIKALCDAIGNPQLKLKCIHVAGTNGKGSTCHMLASVLQEAGYKTGLYTSPHIKDFGERIRINGMMIDPQFVISFTERTKNICEDIQPSFFELTVAMAFEYFAKEGIDIAVIETGLGGRLDSTNIISPILSIITNIGFDHTDILGNTIQAIATEKAGIIKKNIPVVVGETIPETRNVFIQKANENNAAIQFAEEKYIIEYIDPEAGLLICNIKDIESNIVEKLRLDLNGIYQVKNARTVLCSINALRGLGLTLPEKALHDGLENVKRNTGLTGRWDVISKDPAVILDAAHNKDGILQVIEHLSNRYTGSQYHFILGFVKDKDISDILALLPSQSKYYFTNAHIPRALTRTELKKAANAAGLTGESFDNVNNAIQSARESAGKDDVIIVCGSFFVLAEVLEASG